MFGAERTADGALILSGDLTGEAPALLRALMLETPPPHILNLRDAHSPDLPTIQVLHSLRKTLSQAGRNLEIREAGDAVVKRLRQWGLMDG